jgi:AcrR family transcriptional regulator
VAPRRQQIMDVAARLFAERGFHGVTVDHIGAATGVSGPALYHHFAGKEALLGEMLVAISEELLAEGTRRVEAAASPSEALEALLAWHVEFALDRSELITVQLRDLVHAPEASRRRIRHLQGRYVELWVDVLAAGSPGLDRQAARAGAHALFGLLNSTPHSARLGREAMAELLLAMGRAAMAAAVDRSAAEVVPER